MIADRRDRVEKLVEYARLRALSYPGAWRPVVGVMKVTICNTRVLVEVDAYRARARGVDGAHIVSATDARPSRLP